MYKSRAQQAFFHSKRATKAGITKKQIAEWDKKSRGRKLPVRVKKTKKK